MKYPEQVNPQRQNADWWLQGKGRGGNGSNCLMGMGFLWGNEHGSEPDREGGYKTL